MAILVHKVLSLPRLTQLLTPSNPYKVKTGVVLDPKMLFRGYTSIEMELTCKKLGQNLIQFLRFRPNARELHFYRCLTSK